MACVSSFLILLLSSLVLLHSAEEMKFHPSCPPFDCGRLGRLKFPFSDATCPECGLCVVNCNKPVPKIQLERGGRWYEIEYISEADTVGIDDTVLRKHLQHNSCEYFNYLTLPRLPFVHFHITPSLTLFKCNHSLSVPLPKNFNSTRCSDYSIYYNSLSNDALPSLLPQCSVIQLPIHMADNHSYDNLFKRLTSKFSLQVLVTDDCYGCSYRGGQCQSNSEGNFQCSVAKVDDNTKVAGHSKALKLGLGIGGSAMLIIILSFYIMRCYYKRKYSSKKFLSSNTLSEPSSKSDLEGGSVIFGVPIFSHTELEEATNNFDSEKELGDGGFGIVYHGKLRDGREVAVKRLFEHNYRRVEQFMNEIEILARLRHKNLVTLYGCTSRRSRNLLLVYEYIPNGTVADHLHGEQAKPSSLTWPIRMNIAIETASALAYLHASDTIHRDVKTSNILLDNNFCVKVADFGLSRLFPINVTHVSTIPQGTPGYVDPEYRQCYQLTDRSDVYSFGVVLIELISSMPAVDICRHRHEINLANFAMNKIQKCAFDELIDPCLGHQSDEEVRRMTTSVAELAFRCLQQDKEMRPSMDEVLEELLRIQSGEYKFENLEGHENNDVVVVHREKPPPECDEVSLLKNIRLPPPSPNSVTDKYISI